MGRFGWCCADCGIDGDVVVRNEQDLLDQLYELMTTVEHLGADDGANCPKTDVTIFVTVPIGIRTRGLRLSDQPVNVDTAKMHMRQSVTGRALCMTTGVPFTTTFEPDVTCKKCLQDLEELAFARKLAEEDTEVYYTNDGKEVDE
jgi:hypothetical protein